MRAIVCGGGRTGAHIARHLAGDDIEVTVIESSRKVGENLDRIHGLKCIVGSATDPDTLTQAGAADAEIVIAVTTHDEANIVVCQLSHQLFQIRTKIARLRAAGYVEPGLSELFRSGAFPVDVIISPEREVAAAVARRLTVPGALDVIAMADGALKILGVRCDQRTPILNTPLRELTSLFPDLHAVVMVVVRDGQSQILRSEDSLREGDVAYVAANSQQTRRVMAAFGYEERGAQRVVVVGGGNVGLHFVRTIEKEHPQMRISLIEYDHQRAKYVSTQLRRTTVVNGSALRTQILEESGVAQAGVVVALSNDDQVNLLSCLLAKEMGCQRSIALLNEEVYGRLLGRLGLDAVINPQEITISRILHRIRSGRVHTAHLIGARVGEIIEAEILQGSDLIGKPLRDLRLSGGLRLGAVWRRDALLKLDGGTVLDEGDRAILFAQKTGLKKADRLLSAGVIAF